MSYFVNSGTAATTAGDYWPQYQQLPYIIPATGTQTFHYIPYPIAELLERIAKLEKLVEELRDKTGTA